MTIDELPPEARKEVERLQALHGRPVDEIEARIFVRFYDKNELCIDVRNLPYQ